MGIEKVAHGANAMTAAGYNITNMGVFIMAAAKAAATQNELSFPDIEIKEITVKIQGTSPLCVHKFSEKARKMILDKQQKTASKAGKEARNIWEDIIGGCYWLSKEPREHTEEAFYKAIKDGATFGFPTVGVKASIVSAAYRAGWVKNKVSMNGMFHMDGEFIEIKGVQPDVREDTVTLQTGVTDLRFRPLFPVGWYAELKIKYVPQLISVKQLMNAINFGGFSVGLGEWRIEKGGTWGAYKVVE